MVANTLTNNSLHAHKTPLTKVKWMKIVTETDTAATLDGPLGLNGGVTIAHVNTSWERGKCMTFASLKL